ncbi:MAG: ABC transporter permease subunit [Chloroflexi bacterium]|nr:ABC transporter permease subunit [Chloroflexota bacterium]
MLLRTILGKSLRDERAAVIGYGLGLALYGLLIVIMFPSVGQAPGLAEMMESYPPAMKALVGEIKAITTVEGFVALEVLTWLPLILAIFAIMSATDFVAGEAERGTLYLVLSQPVRRWRLVVERMAALTVSLLAMALAAGIGLWLGLPIAKVEMSPANLIAATVATVPLVLVIAGISLLAGCILMSRRLAGLIAAGLAVAFYLLNSLAGVVEQLKPWSRLSPFHYFDAYKTITNGPDLADTLTLLVGAFVLVGASVLVFQRRDILAD